jgi:microcompartment protein CcmL/EutN
MSPAIGLIETHGWAASMAVLDAAQKAAEVAVLQVELNDLYGACVKLYGDVAGIDAAITAAVRMAQRLRARCVARALRAPDEQAYRVIQSVPEHSPLLESDVVFIPWSRGTRPLAGARERSAVETQDDDMTTTTATPPPAIGLIETQGFTAVLEALDTACKAASVEVVGREKLGGGYVTVVITGDVAAVQAAVAAAKAAVGDLGKLIAAHVITGPSEGVLSLLPR